MPLVTQAEVEVLGRFSFGNNPEPLVDQAIAAAQAAIETYCARPFEKEAGRVDTLDGTGGRVLGLPLWPVSGVASITEDAVALADGVDFLWYPDGRLVRGAGLPTDQRRWLEKRQTIIAEYDGGYDDTDAPADLKRVALELVVRTVRLGQAWGNAAEESVGILQITLEGSDSIRYDPKVADPLVTAGLLTDADRRTLSGYMRRDPE